MSRSLNRKREIEKCLKILELDLFEKLEKLPTKRLKTKCNGRSKK